MRPLDFFDCWPVELSKVAVVAAPERGDHQFVIDWKDMIEVKAVFGEVSAFGCPSTRETLIICEDELQRWAESSTVKDTGEKMS